MRDHGRATGAFDGVDFDGFWDDSEYSLENYTEPAPGASLIAEVEQELGFRLPDSFVGLAKIHNGGAVIKDCHPAPPNLWAEDHVQITGIYALGRTSTYSLLGDLGTAFMQEEWGYPDWGIGIADTPSAGHEQIMLDYRECGRNCERGEPSVVHVDQEGDYAVTFLAPDFASFIRGLVPEEDFDEDPELSAAGLQDLDVVRTGEFSPELRQGISDVSVDPDLGAELRRLAEIIVWQNDGFTPRADGTSLQFYDLLFWVSAHSVTVRCCEDVAALVESTESTESTENTDGFLVRHLDMDCLRSWWDNRVNQGLIVSVEDRVEPSTEFGPWVLSWIPKAR